MTNINALQGMVTRQLNQQLSSINSENLKIDANEFSQILGNFVDKLIRTKAKKQTSFTQPQINKAEKTLNAYAECMKESIQSAVSDSAELNSNEVKAKAKTQAKALAEKLKETLQALGIDTNTISQEEIQSVFKHIDGLIQKDQQIQNLPQNQKNLTVALLKQQFSQVLNKPKASVQNTQQSATTKTENNNKTTETKQAAPAQAQTESDKTAIDKANFLKETLHLACDPETAESTVKSLKAIAALKISDENDDLDATDVNDLIKNLAAPEAAIKTFETLESTDQKAIQDLVNLTLLPMVEANPAGAVLQSEGVDIRAMQASFNDLEKLDNNPIKDFKEAEEVKRRSELSDFLVEIGHEAKDIQGSQNKASYMLDRLENSPVKIYEEDRTQIMTSLEKSPAVSEGGGMGDAGTLANKLTGMVKRAAPAAIPLLIPTLLPMATGLISKIPFLGNSLAKPLNMLQQVLSPILNMFSFGTVTNGVTGLMSNNQQTAAAAA